MTISNPYLIFYIAISQGSTILAEFNSKDADLGTLASKCLEKTPPLHVVFSHTVLHKTYSFLIDDHFVFFAIFDENLDGSEGLAFLRSVKDAFNKILDTDGIDRSGTFTSHCFQGEFNPVFHQLLAPPMDLQTPQSPRSGLGFTSSGTPESPRSRTGRSGAWFGGSVGKGLKKKHHRRSSVDSNGGVAESKVDVFNSREVSLSMQKNGLFDFEVTQQKAKRVWKRQIWVVLSLDLIVCSVLFGVWLWVCRGFRCING